ncbi:hypothetical protein C8Q73DRAFT_795046 [Cubamyces lactineus]|nr:hypothetical protein C8Q73DRAFT_795046 [Cubamyces lactineus]
MDTRYGTFWPQKLLLYAPTTTFSFDPEHEDPRSGMKASNGWGYRLPGIGQQSTLWWMRKMGGLTEWEDPNEDEWIPSYLRWEVSPSPIARPAASSPSSPSTPATPPDELGRSSAEAHAEALTSPVGLQERHRPGVENVGVKKPLYERWLEIDNINLIPKVVARE